jgi:hypothetical protein
MKQTILVCDLCTASVPAVESLTVTNGQKTSVASLDVCKKHLGQVLKLFAPGVGDSLRANIAAKLKTGKMSPKQLAELFSVPRWKINQCLARMLAAGEIVKEGNRRNAVYKGKT